MKVIVRTPKWLPWVAALLVSLTTLVDAQAAEPPPARRGFQLSHQLGLVFPAGNATGDTGDRLGRRYNWQWQLLLIGAGAKITENVYLGGYVDVTLGNKGSDASVRSACRDTDSNFENDVTCSAFAVRAGLESRYEFLPAHRANVWVGYGIGPVLAGQAIYDRTVGRREATRVSGWEFARLSAGVTFRLAKAVGVGPYVMGSLGRFYKTTTEVNDQTTFDGPIEQRAFHHWIGAGIKVVIFP